MSKVHFTFISHILPFKPKLSSVSLRPTFNLPLIIYCVGLVNLFLAKLKILFFVNKLHKTSEFVKELFSADTLNLI